MFTRRPPVLPLLLASLLLGCTSARSPEAPMSAEEAHLLGSFGAVDSARVLAEDSTELGLTAVAEASALSGRLTTSGTFTQTGERWDYSRDPSDRMVVAFADGSRVEFTFRTLEGVEASSVEGFLSSSHSLDYTVHSSEQGTLRVESLRRGQDYQVELSGDLRLEGVDLTIDLGMTGWDFFENDSSGMTYEDESAAMGTVTSADFELTVDERWDYVLVSADGSSSSAATKVLSSRLVAGGEDYAWDQCRLQKAFTDGQPGEPDYWQASGGLLRNGALHGACELFSTAHSIGFRLAMDGAQTVLEEWMLSE